MSDLVYSTASGKQKKDNKSDKNKYEKSVGPTKVRLETKGRGGKAVTVLFNLPLEEAEAKKRMKDLQGILACGATLKESTIEFRGDMRQKLKEYYEKIKEPLVFAGG